MLLFSAEQGNTNPLAGQPAWSGNNAGTVNGGRWGTTLVNLGGFARAGDTVRLRWDFGTDICSRTGWFMDNVDVFSCAPNVPSLTVNDPILKESNEDKRITTFTVSLSARTLRPVSVNYSIADGTALHGDDFLPVFVNLSGAVNATIGDNQGKATIANDDPATTLTTTPED